MEKHEWICKWLFTSYCCSSVNGGGEKGGENVIRIIWQANFWGRGVAGSAFVNEPLNSAHWKKKCLFNSLWENFSSLGPNISA